MLSEWTFVIRDGRKELSEQNSMSVSINPIELESGIGI